MRIEQFQYLIKVAEIGSINQSAEVLYISQQGLSQAIQQMEKELGVTLFYRSGNKLLLTKAGQKTIEIAQAILCKYNELITTLKLYEQNNSDALINELYVFTAPIISVTLLPRVLNIFNKKYPKIRIKVIEKRNFDIFENVKETTNSVGLISLPLFEFESNQFLKDDQIKFDELYKCDLKVGVGTTSSLAANDYITEMELLEYPLTIYNIENRILDYLLSGIKKPNIIINTTNLYLTRETIASGLAIGFTNDFLDNYFKNLPIVSIPLEKSIEMIFGCISSSGIPESSPITEFLNMVKNEFKI